MNIIKDSYSKLTDYEFRRKLRENPAQYASELNSNIPETASVKIVTNSKNKLYIAIPVSQGNQLSESDLSHLAAAGVPASSLASVACAGTAATITSTLSTGGSLGTVGSAACG